MSKDLWLIEVERIEQAYADGELTRGEFISAMMEKGCRPCPSNSV